MHMDIKKIFVPFAVWAMVLWMVPAYAQSVNLDFWKVAKTYAEISQCSTRVKTHLFEKEEDARPKMVLNSDIRYNGSGQWVKNQHLEMLYNNRCVLLIDHLKKQIQYSKPVSLDKIRRQSNNAVPDTAALKAYDVSLLKKENGVAVYRLKSKRSGMEFSEIEYKIDLSTYRFREIVYYCHPKKMYRKIRVVYEYFNDRPMFGKNQFSETGIITGKGDKAVLTQAYASYKLLNGYNQNLKKILNDE